MSIIKTPWTDEQVRALNEYQRKGQFHPMTCGGNRSDAAHKQYATEHNEPDLGLLVATNDGWKCPVCDYTQNWTHHFQTQ